MNEGEVVFEGQLKFFGWIKKWKMTRHFYRLIFKTTIFSFKLNFVEQCRIVPNADSISFVFETISNRCNMREQRKNMTSKFGWLITLPSSLLNQDGILPSRELHLSWKKYLSKEIPVVPMTSQWWCNFHSWKNNFQRGMPWLRVKLPAIMMPT